MHFIHILTDKAAQKNLEAAFAINTEDTFEFFILKDELNIGFLKKEGTSFKDFRNEEYRRLNGEALQDPVDDLDNLMAISSRLSNGEESELCLWTGKNAKDVCAYFWLLHYLKKHYEKLSVINIADLPFLDEDNQLFYPILVSELPVKEVLKALKLKRNISSSEWEIYQDEWSSLREINTGLRILKEGKKLESVEENYFDTFILESFQTTNHRLSTHLRHISEQINFQVSENFLKYRISILEKEGLMEGKKVAEDVDENEEA